MSLCIPLTFMIRIDDRFSKNNKFLISEIMSKVGINVEQRSRRQKAETQGFLKDGQLRIQKED